MPLKTPRFACFARLALSSLMLLQLAQPVLAANESWEPFTSLELGLLFLDPAGMADSADARLDSLFGETTQIMQDMPEGVLSAAKPVSDGIAKLSSQILGVAKGHGDALQPHLKPYQILDKMPLRYEQITLPSKASLRSIVERSNGVLKRVYRISETVKVSEALLPQLKTDLGKLSPSDPYQKASLGIVTVSLANLNLGASQAAVQVRSDLEPLQQQVERLLKDTQSQVTSNPMNAFSLAEDVQVLTSLTSTLTRASGHLADSGKKLPSVLSSLQGMLSQL